MCKKDKCPQCCVCFIYNTENKYFRQFLNIYVTQPSFSFTEQVHFFLCRDWVHNYEGEHNS